MKISQLFFIISLISCSLFSQEKQVIQSPLSLGSSYVPETPEPTIAEQGESSTQGEILVPETPLDQQGKNPKRSILHTTQRHHFKVKKFSSARSDLVSLKRAVQNVKERYDLIRIEQRARFLSAKAHNTTEESKKLIAQLENLQKENDDLRNKIEIRRKIYECFVAVYNQKSS